MRDLNNQMCTKADVKIHILDQANRWCLRVHVYIHFNLYICALSDTQFKVALQVSLRRFPSFPSIRRTGHQRRGNPRRHSWRRSARLSRHKSLVSLMSNGVMKRMLPPVCHSKHRCMFLGN